MISRAPQPHLVFGRTEFAGKKTSAYLNLSQIEGPQPINHGRFPVIRWLHLKPLGSRTTKGGGSLGALNECARRSSREDMFTSPSHLQNHRGFYYTNTYTLTKCLYEDMYIHIYIHISIWIQMQNTCKFIWTHSTYSVYIHICVYIYTVHMICGIYICIIGNHHMPADCIHSPHLRPSSHPAGWKAAARRGNTSLSWAFCRGCGWDNQPPGRGYPMAMFDYRRVRSTQQMKKQPESVWSCVENHGRPENLFFAGRFYMSVLILIIRSRMEHWEKHLGVKTLCPWWTSKQLINGYASFQVW